ncbi:Fic family protein [Dongia sp.]|uniref:Fic family protein n=1 Tax=Dongia sp. TaxID=1977262 RepID=UPI0035B12B31
MWIWQQLGWPQLTYDSARLDNLEQQFLLRAGAFIGAFKHVGAEDRDAFRIELISDEALKTSAIEGEVLNRESVQFSLRQQFGLGGATGHAPPREQGIAEMMADLYRHSLDPLTHETLFAWHSMVMNGNRRLRAIGEYRSHPEPMQVVSDRLHEPAVFFEAPPSARMQDEMAGFIAWFTDTAPQGKAPLPSLARAGIAHLYFVCIHPFEDGNGRIARALAEKSLAQNLGQPSLIALAFTIERARKEYYAALARNNRSTEITNWLVYFAETILTALENTHARIDFHIAKARFYDAHRGRLNARQEKAITRMFREGIDGFKGGLSAENYIGITRASRATATRDLQNLVEKGALTKTGSLRHTRYWLNLPMLAR